MENLEELKKKYEELGKEIERLENQKKNKRWRAECGEEEYYYVNDYGEIEDDYDCEGECDNFRYKSRNYFKTEEEAQEYLDNINTYYELMDLAEELNNGMKIDWNDYDQSKYYIYYDFEDNKFRKDFYYISKTIGQIYCLNENFLDIALERIGEERLEKLFKGE